MEQLLTPDQVAEVLGITADQVRRYAAAGRIGSVRLGPSSRSPVRFREQDVIEFIERGARPAVSAQELKEVDRAIPSERLPFGVSKLSAARRRSAKRRLA
ncbi:helix-turn-helix domain-containing protein [Schaalia georgiae]|nr:helix-turn-helix domain-containing protein [Schaalia georgiae]